MLVRTISLLGLVALCLLLAGCSTETSTPTERRINADVEALAQVIVKLHDRVKALEAHITTDALTATGHTHQNDHWHGFGLSIHESGYHTHLEYAESEHRHWGYADEFHTHGND